MGRKKNIEQLQNFRRKLAQGIWIEKMILFGSRAGGKAKGLSDFDLLIVSSSFRKKSSLERPLGFYRYWDLDYPVDFLCYTPKEFKKLSKRVTIVQEAVKNWIEIKE